MVTFDEEEVQVTCEVSFRVMPSAEYTRGRELLGRAQSNRGIVGVTVIETNGRRRYGKDR